MKKTFILALAAAMMFSAVSCSTDITISAAQTSIAKNAVSETTAVTG